MMYEIDKNDYINTDFIIAITSVQPFLTEVTGKIRSCGFYITLQGSKELYVSKTFNNREDAETERRKLLSYMNYGV